MALNFNQFAAEANLFLKAYTKELNLEDTEQAGRILSSILHGLRDVFSIEESLNLIAQFPMFLKRFLIKQLFDTTNKKKGLHYAFPFLVIPQIGL